ncbi:MAG: hypothetical protein RL653_2859 [Pseudomonadota bacterium]|jgi:penicillin-binding protein 1A
MAARWIRNTVVALGGVGLLGLGGGAAALWAVDHDLPSVEGLRHYRPPQVTKVTCADGSTCAEFYAERRTWVPLASLPRHVTAAFVSAEDAHFYEHEGLDYAGMLRAAWRTVTGRPQGASTISQQACRNLLLTRERTVERKLKEIVLTRRMEKALSKAEILELYLNQVYFGHQRYGVEEAALYYFGHGAKELSVGEAAVLAGTVQLPERINPVTSMVKARARQRYVLTQMARHGHITAEVMERELNRPILLAGPRPPRVGSWYAEEIRRQLLASYGEKALLSGGLKVDIALEPRLQAASEKAVREGLEALDRRHGYRGAPGVLDGARFEALKARLAVRLAEAGRRRPDEELVADLAPLAEPRKGTEDEGTEEAPAETPEGEAPEDDEAKRARAVPLRPLAEGLRLSGFVRAVDGQVATVDFVGRQGELKPAGVSWARRRLKGGKLGPAPKKVSDAVAVGELVRVRVVKAPPVPAPLELQLDQEPEAEGAFVLLDAANRHVVALVGGYDMGRSAFNRATQARRQPGSAFKPFVYGAALESHRYTPSSVVNDAPETVRDEATGKTWKPQNFERAVFEGPMTLRAALTRSKNTVSVRLLEALGPQVAIDFARRAGIRSPLPENLTLALGTGEVGVLELANAYATLQAGGRWAEPLMLLRVRDAEGKVLEAHAPAFEQRVDPAVAYLATSLMQSVVEEGTAVAVKELGRPAAGKTGTASESRDAWFSGYTAHHVGTAWVGFDDHSPLGSGETGGRAALPIWLEALREAERTRPSTDFDVPKGVLSVHVDPATGLLAPEGAGREELFLEGTQPTEEAPPAGTVAPENFFLEDGR